MTKIYAFILFFCVTLAGDANQDAEESSGLDSFSLMKPSLISLAYMRG